MKDRFPEEFPELRAQYDLDLESLKRGVLIAQQPMLRPTQIRLLIIAIAGAPILWAAFRLPIAAAVWLLVYLALAWAIPWRSLRATMNVLKPESTPGVLGEHTVEVGRTALVESTKSNRSAFKLESVDWLARRDNLLVVLINRAQVIVIPADGDFGEHTFEGFCEHLTALWEAAKDATPETAFGTV